MMTDEIRSLSARVRALEILTSGLAPATLSAAAYLQTEPTMSALIREACFETGTSVAEILSDRREKRLFRVRCAIAWVARKATDYSLPRIARAMGDRDHSTILSAIRRADQFREIDPAFLRLTDRLLARVPDRTASTEEPCQ